MAEKEVEVVMPNGTKIKFKADENLSGNDLHYLSAKEEKAISEIAERRQAPRTKVTNTPEYRRRITGDFHCLKCAECKGENFAASELKFMRVHTKKDVVFKSVCYDCLKSKNFGY